MKESAYDFIYKVLKRKITSGEYPEQSLLPPEPAFCKMFGVSKTTVRHAVDLLVQDGYVKPQRGIGTVVLKMCVAQNLNRLSSMTQTLTEKGYEVSLKQFHISIMPADERIAQRLGIKAGDKVACIHRVMCASGTPVAVLYNYIPYILVEGIEKYSGKFISLYRFLQEEYFITIEKTNDNLSASNATPEVAGKLDVCVGFALIKVDRVCICDRRAVCYDEVSARSDMYSYQTSLFNNKG